MAKKATKLEVTFGKAVDANLSCVEVHHYQRHTLNWAKRLTQSVRYGFANYIHLYIITASHQANLFVRAGSVPPRREPTANVSDS